MKKYLKARLLMGFRFGLWISCQRVLPYYKEIVTISYNNIYVTGDYMFCLENFSRYIFAVTKTTVRLEEINTDEGGFAENGYQYAGF